MAHFPSTPLPMRPARTVTESTADNVTNWLFSLTPECKSVKTLLCYDVYYCPSRGKLGAGFSPDIVRLLDEACSVGISFHDGSRSLY
jgi:hypothetical protein